MIEAHLFDGNTCNVLRELDDYRTRLADAVGLTPSPELTTLVGLPRLAS